MRKTLSALVCAILISPAQANWPESASIQSTIQSTIDGADVSAWREPPKTSLALGAESEDVTWLANRLMTVGYLGAGGDGLGVTRFDESIEEALKSFQRDNGLKDDGVLGPASAAKLSGTSPETLAGARAWQTAVDGWVNDYRGRGANRIIVVNIPTFTLHAIDLGGGYSSSRVIVGAPHTRTPLMTTNIINLKANPDWSPPKSIRGARYTRPGPRNPLGLMRFSTDNTSNIYLHDTNSRHLFERDVRALSHGCVRVQEWENLAMWLDGRDEAWLQDEALAGGLTRYIPVEKTPVIITYFLVDVDSTGSINQGVDVYGRKP